ncbi:hypothetical protein EVA_09409 [gut metagenome]|uniref:Uncharacterized protein n=1 Tax=gut metagenome TaxID=749906 RepID=J9GQY0_9ZZZZ
MTFCYGTDTAVSNLETAYPSFITVYFTGKLTINCFYAPVHKNLEIAVRSHQSLQLYLVSTYCHATYNFPYVILRHKNLYIGRFNKSFSGYTFGKHLGKVAVRNQPRTVNQRPVFRKIFRHQYIVLSCRNNA